MARKTASRQLKHRELTIIGEGLTERCYFTTLRKLKGYEYNCKPRNFTEQDYASLQRLIDQTLMDGGIAVCVFDEDVARENAAEAKKLAEMKARYEGNEDVLLCSSMPSIEFWFLLHYVTTSRFFATSADVIAALRKHIADFEKHDRFLTKERWVKEMTEDGRLQAACERAKRLVAGEHESFSNLWKLFDRMSRLP